MRGPPLMLAVAIALAAAGCGTADRTVQAPAQRAAAAAATATPGTPRPVAVRIRDFEFAPRTVHVAVGATVTWLDRDAANHTVTFRRGPGDLGNLDQGQSRSVGFASPGRYTYVCQYHPNMRGTVVVG